MAALPASAQINTSGITEFNRGVFNLAEAYPCAVGTYAANLGIADQQIFTGVCPSQGSAPGAAPGILCLARKGSSLDVNCFAVTPRRTVRPCFVQAFRLIKQVPGSFKCPDVYGLPHFDKDGNLMPLYQLLPVRHGRPHLVEPQLHPAGHQVHPRGRLRLPHQPATGGTAPGTAAAGAQGPLDLARGGRRAHAAERDRGDARRRGLAPWRCPASSARTCTTR